MEKEQKFMTLFKKLEKFLRIEYNKGDYSHSGFVSTIYRIKKSNKHPVIANKYNFDMLLQASQMRNIIAHNQDVLTPSDNFLKRFEKVVDDIIHPKTVYDVMVRFNQLSTINKQTTIGDAVHLLKEKGYNTLPVIEGDELIGLFTEKSLFDYFSMHRTEEISKAKTINHMIEAIDLNTDPRHFFAFVRRDLSVQDAYDVFTSDLKSRRELLLLLVTEHGKPTEKLLGIVALRDLENAIFH